MMIVRNLLLVAIGTGAIAASAVAHDTVRYATDGYGLGALIIAAAEKGYFAEQGISPVIETYSYGIDTVDAVLAGNAEFGVVIDMPLLTRFSAGKLISPAIIGTPKPGYHKLYAASGLNGPNDFKGKNFGVATGTAQEFLTRTYLSQLGLDPDKDVKLVGAADLFTIVGAMKAGRVDAAWVWAEGVEPIKSDANFHFIADDSVVHQDTSALLVTSKDFAATHSDLVVKTLKALEEASIFLGENSQEAAVLVSSKVGADVDAVKAGIEDNRYALELASGPVGSLREKYDFLVKSGKIKPYDFASQFDADDLKTAVPGVDIDASLK